MLTGYIMLVRSGPQIKKTHGWFRFMEVWLLEETVHLTVLLKMTKPTSSATTTSLKEIPANVGPELCKKQFSSLSTEKGYKYFLEGYIHNVKIDVSREEKIVKAKCYRSQRKSEKPHDVYVCLLSSEISEAQCSCKAGRVLIVSVVFVKIHSFTLIQLSSIKLSSINQYCGDS